VSGLSLSVLEAWWAILLRRSIICMSSNAACVRRWTHSRQRRLGQRTTRLFGEVNTLVGEVVTARRDIPLGRHQAEHDRYDLPVRVLGGVVALFQRGAYSACSVCFRRITQFRCRT
jgi:hypothetical protein